MLRPSSVQKPYDLFFSGDPALRQPPDLPSDATAEQVTEHAKALEEHRRTVELARKTSDWTALIIPGQAPTRFGFRVIPSELRRRLFDRLGRTDAEGNASASITLDWIQLAFRAALVDVTNLGDVQVKQVKHELGMLASPAITDVLDSIDPQIVNELGMIAWERSTMRDPT